MLERARTSFEGDLALLTVLTVDLHARRTHTRGSSTSSALSPTASVGPTP
jgi:hypothetical protein